MINSTNSEFEVTQEKELAYILSRFNQDYVYLIVEESLKNRLRNYSCSMPNVVSAMKQEFEVIKTNYNNLPEISNVENEAYKQIIALICNRYDLVCTLTDGDFDTECYLIAYCLYNLLVSNFQENVVNFFTNFILSEKDSLYRMLELSNTKKNKDTSTLYAKKVFKDTKLGVISANLEYVVQSICSSIDIDFSTYVNFVYYNDTKTSQYILERVGINTADFFKTYIAPIFNLEYRAVILTTIRLNLQTLLASSEINASPMEFIKQGE